VCLARGGLRAGDVLSRGFQRPLGVLSTSSYREVGGTVQGALSIAEHVSCIGALKGPHCLLVDDLADSGETLAQVVPVIQSRYPDIREIRTAVLWQKQQSSFRPDYCVERLEGNPWIHQPFEAYDRLRPEDLKGSV